MKCMVLFSHNPCIITAARVILTRLTSTVTLYISHNAVEILSLCILITSDTTSSPALCEGSQASSACPSDKNTVKTKMSLEILTGKTEVLGEKSVPVPLCPYKISGGLTWDRSRVPAVTAGDNPSV